MANTDPWKKRWSMTNETAALHWNSFYEKQLTTKPTQFLRYCLESSSRAFLITKHDTVIDLGCGNGRDMLTLKQRGYSVTGIDLSETAVSKINDTAGEGAAVVCPFSDLPSLPIKVAPTVIYARFVFHAVTLKDEVTALEWAFNTLGKGGRLLIECRTVYDELYGKGEPVGDNAFIDGHYRRFLDLAFADRIKKAGFEIRATVIDDGVAVFGEEDPIVMRIAAWKVVE
ncbi:MAG: class I SAM-dependent methyltransferase [Planctomycetota bacterium]